MSAATSSRIEPIVKAVTDGSKTAVSYVEAALGRLDDVNGEFNVALGIARDRALERARAIDAKVAAGQPVGRLAGVPFIAKDNFLTFATNTTAASDMLRGFTSPYQATAIERLEAAGAIMIAKANLDAFAHGSSTENSDFGPTKNPVDPTRVPGGSSGGSAAAVALDIVPFALGTDTGGSIRLPASFCGVVGLKPTYGTVSRFGVVAMASSTDVVGPLAHTAEDAALVLDVMAGLDERDATTLQQKTSFILGDHTRATGPMKIGVVKEYMTDDVDPEVKDAVNNAINDLRSAGHSVEEVSLPSLPLALAVYYIVVPAEISSNLARYDGMRYGLSDQGAHSLADVYAGSRERGFNAENKRRILIGNYVLSSGYYDAYYRKAQTVRTLLIRDFAAAFETYDALVGPVAPTAAFKIGENVSDPLKMYLADIMTVAVSLAGLPAVSVPVVVDDGALPVGLQIIGRQRDDKMVLQVARDIMNYQGKGRE